MNKQIDLEQLKSDAVHVFTNGFACSEAVIYALRKNFGWDMPDDAIAMSTGFPWGLGGAGCICGALAGGIMCIGYVYGRRVPGDPKNIRCFALCNELHDCFTGAYGASCCRVLTHGYEKESPERKAKCIKQVEGTVVKTAEIIMREMAKDE